jgi:hypothetical protein
MFAQSSGLNRKFSMGVPSAADRALVRLAIRGIKW